VKSSPGSEEVKIAGSTLESLQPMTSVLGVWPDDDSLS
jgi:hypothetical protein